MSDTIKVSVPEQLSSQGQIHQRNADLHTETSGAVQSAHGQMAGAWRGGGFDEISQYFQEFSQHLTKLSALHRQTGTNLDQSRENHESTEATNTSNMS